MRALSHMEAHQIARDLGCLMSSRELVSSVSFVPADARATPRRAPGLFATIASWWTRRRTVRELRRLPDGLLRDIGVERDRIDEVASGLTARELARPPFEA